MSHLLDIRNVFIIFLSKFFLTGKTMYCNRKMLSNRVLLVGV